MNLKAFALVLLGALTSPAATLTWTNTAGGNWQQASNWEPNQIPTAGDTARIITPGVYSVALANNVTVAALALGAASGAQTLTINGNILNVTSGGTINTNGTLTITGGG